MPKYVVLYTAPVSAADQMGNNDPEMAGEVMKAWNDWSAKVGGGMVDLGLPLGNGRKVTSQGSSEAGTEVAVTRSSRRTVSTKRSSWSMVIRTCRCQEQRSRSTRLSICLAGCRRASQRLIVRKR